MSQDSFNLFYSRKNFKNKDKILQVFKKYAENENKIRKCKQTNVDIPLFGVKTL